MKKNPFTPKDLRELAASADKGSLGDGPAEILPEGASDALLWAAKEIEQLRKKVSWMFVMRNRGQGVKSGPKAP